MKYIIKVEENPSGSRPALQSWDGAHCPDGYAFCGEKECEVFYSTTPAGFVDITTKEIDGELWVDTIAVNQEAIDAYNETHPIAPETDPEPTQFDRVEAQALYTAMMTGTLIEEA